MDEPLSNLDAKLRVSMRDSLSQLQERLGVTTVYVTHDQVEAMTLGQRVCVLREAKRQQADTPQTLFNAPVNLFVAGFIGSPAMNFVTARLIREEGPAVSFAGHRLGVPEALLTARPGLDGYFGRDLILGIRPSDFEDAGLADPGWARMPVTAGVTEDLGSEIHVLFTIDAPQVQHSSITQAVAGDDEDTAIPLNGGKSLRTARASIQSSSPSTAWRSRRGALTQDGPGTCRSPSAGPGWCPPRSAAPWPRASAARRGSPRRTRSRRAPARHR